MFQPEIDKLLKLRNRRLQTLVGHANYSMTRFSAESISNLRQSISVINTQLGLWKLYGKRKLLTVNLAIVKATKTYN